MRNSAIIFLSIVLSVFTSSCIFIGPSISGNGKVAEEIREVDSFSAIKVSRGMNVYISQGEEQKVVVKADMNLLDVIETRVEGDALKITTNERIRHSKSKKVFVTVTDIEEISAFAGSNVFTESGIEAKSIEISGSAGSNMKLEIHSKKILVSGTAGSNINLKGSTEKIDIKGSAGSNIKARELNAESCKVKTSSGSNIWVHAEKEIEANASSGGNVYYYGNPEAKDIHTSSGGNIIKK